MLETGSNQVAVVSQILSKYDKKKIQSDSWTRNEQCKFCQVDWVYEKTGKARMYPEQQRLSLVSPQSFTILMTVNPVNQL